MHSQRKHCYLSYLYCWELSIYSKGRKNYLGYMMRYWKYICCSVWGLIKVWKTTHDLSLEFYMKCGSSFFRAEHFRWIKVLKGYTSGWHTCKLTLSRRLWMPQSAWYSAPVYLHVNTSSDSTPAPTAAPAHVQSFSFEAHSCTSSKRRAGTRLLSKVPACFHFLLVLLHLGQQRAADRSSPASHFHYKTPLDPPTTVKYWTES